MCDDTKQDYEFRKSKWREDLHGHMSDMPRAFYNRLTSVAQCDQIIAWYESEGVKAKTAGRRQSPRGGVSPAFQLVSSSVIGYLVSRA